MSVAGLTVTSTSGNSEPVIEAAGDRAGLQLKGNNASNAGDYFVYSMRTDLADVVSSVFDASAGTFSQLFEFDYTTPLLKVTPNTEFLGTITVGSFGSGSGVGAAWGSYSPTFTAATTNPTMGNSTINAYYKQIGKTVDVRIHVTHGSTFSAGSGTYTVSLPVTARAYENSTTPLGNAYFIDGSTRYLAFIHFVSTTTIGAFTINAAAAASANSLNFAHNAPFTAATGDQWNFQFRYEAA